MKDCLTIGQAARLTGMTTETLRHYDRIGLITPSQRDEWSGYRYYTRQDIVRLNTVQALRCMELSLQEIQQILACSQLEELIGLLLQAEAKADARIAQLHAARSRIARARQAYESKRSSAQARGGLFVQQLPERIVVLSQEPAEPSLETLWNYLAPFTISWEPDPASSMRWKTPPASIAVPNPPGCSPSAAGIPAWRD